jgi:hypothetical protein
MSFTRMRWQDPELRKRGLLGVLLIILGVLLLQNFWIQPQLRRQQLLQSRHEELQKQLGNLPSLPPAAPAARSSSESTSLPELSPADAQLRLLQILEDTSLEILEQTTGAPRTQGDWVTFPLQLVISGTYTEFWKFWQRLRETPGLSAQTLRMQSLRLDQADPQLRIELELHTFQRKR